MSSEVQYEWNNWRPIFHLFFLHCQGQTVSNLTLIRMHWSKLRCDVNLPNGSAGELGIPVLRVKSPFLPILYGLIHHFHGENLSFTTLRKSSSPGPMASSTALISLVCNCFKRRRFASLVRGWIHPIRSFFQPHKPLVFGRGLTDIWWYLGPPWVGSRECYWMDKAGACWTSFGQAQNMRIHVSPGTPKGGRAPCASAVPDGSQSSRPHQNPGMMTLDILRCYKWLTRRTTL